MLSSRERQSAEGLARHAIYHELQIDAVARQVEKVRYLEFRLEFLGQDRGILRAHPERDQRARIEAQTS